MRWKGLWYWPVWLFELLTGGKSFKDNPLIGNNWLNRLGLHVLRYLLAHAVARVRRAQLALTVPATLRAQFRRDGYLIIENFLPQDLFVQLKADCYRGNGQCRQLTQADTLTQRYLLDEATAQTKPSTQLFLQFPRLRALLRYTAASNLPTLSYAQVIRHGARAAGADPQKTLHSDTFHPTMKGWLFLQDVVPEDGPFTYVPGSHRLSWRRLCWEYRKSISIRRKPDGFSEKGSLRISSAELEMLGLPQPKAMTVPANTLVLADTHGFHARGEAQPGRSRREIWFYNRTNPFLPWVVLQSNRLNRLTHQTLHWQWRQRDIQQQQSGRPAVWQQITDQQFECD